MLDKLTESFALVRKSASVLAVSSDEERQFFLREIAKSLNENKAEIKALVKALKSEKVRKYVEEHYPNGEVVVVF